MSHEIQKSPEKNPSLTEGLRALKNSLPSAPIFAFLENSDRYIHKKRKLLKDGETLFEPGENPYFYIVSAGLLKIYRINPSGDKKEVGIAGTGAFIGEGIISGRTNKEVAAISATPHTEVVAYTKEDLEYLESLSPETLAKLYKHIMDFTSLRLANTSKELAILSEAAVLMPNFKEMGEEGLYHGIAHIKNALDLDYVISVERHPIVTNLLSYGYDTFMPKPTPRKERVIMAIFPKEAEVRTSDGVIRGSKKGDNLYFLPLKSGEEVRWYLILGRKEGKSIDDSVIRTAGSLAPYFTSIIENNQKIADEKAKSMKDSYAL